MKDSNYRISLDVRQTQSQATIPVKINDVSRKLYISLTDGGTPYIIEEGCFAVLSGIKSDGTTLLNNCIIEDNVIRYDFTQQTVSAQGMVICEVILYDVNGGLLLSPHITIIVDDRAGKASSTVSYNEHNFIDQALEAEASRISAEASRVTAEASRVAAENTRQNQETERVEAEFLRTLEEEIRASNEEARKTNEAKRASAEQTRTTNEIVRNQAETERVAAENSRVFAERARETAETKRELAIETVRSMVIECEASGEVITLNDASNAPLSNLKIFGRTTQKTTTGKNKLPSEAKTLVQNGVTFTANGDGTVTVNGTATDGAEMKEPNQAVILPVGKYILNGCQGGSNNTYYLLVATINDSGTYERLATDTGSGASFELTTAKNVFFILRVLKGVTVSNVVFKPMVRLATETDATYEQYTGGIPSPNPDYPQDLVSVGDSGFDVLVSNGVLVDFKNATSRGNPVFSYKGNKVHYENNTGESCVRDTKGILLPAGVYTAYIKDLVGSNQMVIGVNGKYLTSAVQRQVIVLTEPKTLNLMITTNNLISQGTYDCYCGIVAGDVPLEQCPTIDEDLPDIQSLEVPLILPGLSVSSGGNHIDEEGKQWLSDVAILELGYTERKVHKVTFDGTESWVALSDGRVAIVMSEDLAPKTDLYTPANALCNITSAVSWGDLTNVTNGFATASESSRYIGFKLQGLTENLDTWKSYLASNPVTVIYELKTSGKEMFPLTEIVDPVPVVDDWLSINFKKLHTIQPNTTILNSESAYQELVYIVDSQSYIDNMTRHNSKTTAWSGKNWVAFGDSITAITNGNGLNLGWAAYVNSHYGFNNFYGRGVGGQSFIWNANTFYANTDGTYAGRYGQQGLTSAPKGTTEHKGCFSSWDRIKTMIPDSIKNTIDFVFIMGGTNDIGTFSDRIKWTTPNFNAQNVTDTDWLNASEYNGGDYDVNTFSGAICSAIMKMQIRCPNAIIVIGTPLAKWVDKNAYSKNGVTMEDVADIMIKTARYMSIPYIDVNGTCGINGFNYTKYITDGTHPYCDAGYRMLARTINGGLKNILPHDNGGV